MPLPLLPLIMAGGALAGEGVNAMLQSGQNKKTRKWNEKMYGIQRADALADYNMQNEYNSPSSQMARLRDAGLNPNLVYGDGATTTGATVRSSSAPSWNPQSPRVSTQGLNNGIMSYYDLKLREAQTDNLKTQNTVLMEEKALKAAQTYATLVGANKTGIDATGSAFDISQRMRLADTAAEAAQASLNKIKADTQYTLDQNERQKALQAPTLTKAAIDILQARKNLARTDTEVKEIEARITNLEKDSQIKQWEIDLNKNGMTKGDELYWRALSELLKGTISIENFKKQWNKPRAPFPKNPADATMQDIF